MPAPHPGKILLQEYLRPLKISQNALARAIQVPPRRINEIILGKRAITADTAVRLGLYFNVSAGYWMQLQAAFDIDRVETDIISRLGDIQAPPVSRKLQTVASTNVHRTKSGSSIIKRLMR